MLRAVITAAIRERNPAALDSAFAQAGPAFIDSDPVLVGSYLLDLGGSGSAYSPLHLLRLGGLLEKAGDMRKAIGVYQLTAQRFGGAAETEAALYRMAHCCWNTYRDSPTALSCLADLAQRFPVGEMAPYARQLRQQIEQGVNAGQQPLH